MTMNRQQWTLVSGLGMGAGLMYLLDPQAGGRRRALVRDKAVSAYSSGSDVLRKTSRDLGNRSKGLAAGVRSKLKKTEEDADDLVLRDRVRSKMGRWVSKAGAIDVTVQDCVVTLRGHVPEDEVDRLLKKVRKVKGVEDVVCELAIGDSEDASSLLSEGEVQGSTRNWSKAARLLAGTAGGALAVAALTQRSKMAPALGATLGTVGLGLLAGGVGGSNVNPKRLLKRRGHSQDQGQSLTDGESGQSFGDMSGDGLESKALADSGGDGSAVRHHDSHEHGKSESKSDRFDYEPVHTH
ncbi:MAG TPA: BON domain-containing protein [Thermoanaerobaculia bacterium]|nr:BON domain-containing protein [Thermoanaerobaculia bacterium]